MVSDLHSAEKANPNEVVVPEFGAINTRFLSSEKTYGGRTYVFTAEMQKSICEILSFNANFDMPAIHTAFVDIWQGEAHVICEIARNTKPQDLGIRYSRDRWSPQDVNTRTAEGIKPTIRSEYHCRNLAETTSALAELINVSLEKLNHILVRIDFKTRTCGLLTETQNISTLPEGFAHEFDVPKSTVANAVNEPVPTEQSPNDSNETEALKDIIETKKTEIATTPGDSETPKEKTVVSETTSETLSRTDSAPERVPYVSPSTTSQRAYSEPPRRNADPQGQAKYATYSQSEIDRMFKQQGESILSSLSGKMSAQQRAFTEAVEKQEKTFGKLSEKLSAEYESARVKLEAVAKDSRKELHDEMEEFHKLLSKELEQHRSQLNKAIVPISKALDDKSLKHQPKETKAPEKSGGGKHNPKELELNRKLMIVVVFLSLVSIFMSFANMATVAEIKQAVKAAPAETK